MKTINENIDNNSTIGIDLKQFKELQDSRIASLNIIEDLSIEIEKRIKTFENLQKSEEKFKKAFETSPNSIVITRLRDGLFVSINQGFTKITGYNYEDVAGKTSSEINIWQNPQDRKNIVEQLLTQGEARDFEAKFLTKNGATIIGLMSATIIELDGEKHILNITHDITERKLKEEQLQNSEELHRIISNLITDYVYSAKIYKDKRIETEWIIGAFEKITGYSFDEIKQIENGFLKIINPEDLKKIYSINSIEIFEYKETQADYRITDKSGKERWIVDYMQPIKSQSTDEYVKVFGAVKDITEQKYALEIMHESEDKFRNLVENAFDGIYIMKNNRFSYVNQRFCKLTGYTFDELTTKDFKPETTLTEKSIHVIEELNIKREKNEYTSGTHEFELITKSGKVKDVEAITVKLSSNNEYEILGVIRDISERKKMIADLIEARNKAVESDNLKTAFLNNVSHEIRTPLNAINGFSEMLNLAGLTSEKRKTYIDIITNSCNRLTEIVTDIFNIALIEAGQVTINESEVNINQILNELTELFHDKALKKKVIFRVKKSLENKNANIITDSTKLFQILNNLIGNALKFTFEGYIYVNYYIENEYIKFIVEDTGIGIPKENQHSVFERFRQANPEISTKFGGTGLGLSIAKSYVELLGGNIYLQSEPNIGSSFTFTILYKPVYESNHQKNENFESKLKLKSTRKTILIAEDESYNFELIKCYLSEDEFYIYHANNGQEAIELCQQNPEIDIIIMDIKMPVINGYEATKLIKQMRPDLPIIAQTAYALGGDREKAISACCDDYISKPIRKKELINIINKYI